MLLKATLFFRMFAAMVLAGWAVAFLALLMVRWYGLSAPVEPLQSMRPQWAQLAALKDELIRNHRSAAGWGFLPRDTDARDRWWRDAVARSQRAACLSTTAIACSSPLGERTALVDSDGRVLAGFVPYRLLIASASINTWSAPLVASGGTIGHLQIADPGNPRDDVAVAFLIQRQSRLLAAAVTGLLAMAAAAAWLAWRFRGPIRQLQEVSNRLADGRFDLRLPATRSDELGDLARAFNRMAERLQAMDASQRRWVSDSAHELRTPLAVLQAQIEAMIDGVRPAGAQQLQLLLRQTRSLSRLVGDLHALALADAGAPVAHRQQCDVWHLLEQCAAAFSERATAAGLTLQISPAPGRSLVNADAGRLQQLFDNLLENCVRYTSTGGQIFVDGQAEGRFLRLRFDDAEPGVPPELLARLGERFFRVDKARTRSGVSEGQGGSGLGLALCRQFVAAHEGDIAFDASPLGGLRVIVTLPLTD